MWGIISTWTFALDATANGAKLLSAGGSAEDALVATANQIELDPAIDCVGYGGFPNRDGEMELDAAIMDGNTLDIGAVSAIKHYPNAIEIAREILRHSPHNLISGPGAEEFAAEQGFHPAETLSPEARQKWLSRVEQERARATTHDTVGIVALDMSGAVFAGTSTSGIAMKHPGRVGDSPLVGSGFYADSDVGGAAATGLGEDIMKLCISYACVRLMREGMSPTEAAETAVRQAHERLARYGKNPGNIAVICMDNSGRYGGAANHEGFSYAIQTADEPARLVEVKPILLRASSNTHLETINNLYD